MALTAMTRRPASWRRDIAVAVAVGVVQLALMLAVNHAAPDVQPERDRLDALAVVLIVAGPAALVVRRRWPVVALAGAFAATLAYWLQNYPRGPVFLALAVALVTVVTLGYRTVAWAVLALGYVGFAWLRPLYAEDDLPNLAQAFGLAAWLIVLGTVAEIVRSRRERRLEALHAQAEEARRRASEERLLIARELHDVLAHNISLINVQAGVALHLLDDRPEQARPALAAIKETSKEALGELRSVLDVLRRSEGGEPAPLAPTAGLGDLDGLVERTRAAGQEVALEVTGHVRAVPAGVDLAAFRIVQEALTNVVRHAPGSRAAVRLAYDVAELRVQIDDDGYGPSPGRGESGTGTDTGPDVGAEARREHGLPGAGRGIAGMRERVQALGGTFAAGPRPGRGFRVRAQLPITPVAPDAPPPTGPPEPSGAAHDTGTEDAVGRVFDAGAGTS